MNYKLLFPTYRNRYLFVQQQLKAFGSQQSFSNALNLGTGEGDYDSMIAAYCDHLTGCDINEADVAFAQQLNREISNISYQVENALDLSFEEATFDLIVSVEVIEHVGQPAKMMEEISRVLKPGGIAILTFPSLKFPITYDPVNRVLSNFTDKKVSMGAYAFGHDYLIDPQLFKTWAGENGLEVAKNQKLSGYLVGLLEVYWTGFVQKIAKANSGNVSGQDEKRNTLRPSTKEPALTAVTDGILQLDKSLFLGKRYSVGEGFVLKKK